MPVIVGRHMGIGVFGTFETLAAVRRLIVEAEQEVVLVSPYVDLVGNLALQRALEQSLSHGLRRTELVVRAGFLDSPKNAAAKDIISGLALGGLKVFEVEYLHAKVYASEKCAVATSLNLLASSFANGIEIGVQFERATAEYLQLMKVMREQLDAVKLPYSFDATPRKRASEVAGARAKSERSLVPKKREPFSERPGTSRTVANRPPSGSHEVFCLRCRKFYVKAGTQHTDLTDCPDCGRNYHTNAKDSRPRVCMQCFDDAYAESTRVCPRCNGVLEPLWASSSAGSGSTQDSHRPAVRDVEKSKAKGPMTDLSPSEGGHCIRCAEDIDLNPERPYCRSDFKKWAAYRNPDYEDAYCHGCGEDYPATMNKPFCDECYEAVVAVES